MRGYDEGVRNALRFLGLAGVDPNENPEAYYWERMFAWPMLIMAFWLIIQWFLEDHGMISAGLANFLCWLIWFAFVAETVILTWVVDQKWRYLQHNWMNLFIIASAFPVIWGTTPMTVMLRALRILVIPRMIIAWWRRN